MKPMRRFPKTTLLILSVLAVLVVAIGGAAGVFVTDCRGFSCIAVARGRHWRIRETYESKGNVWRGMMDNGSDRMRLEVIRGVTQSDADTFTKIRLTTVAGLYDTTLSPYPGAVSATIRCDDMYKPKPQIMKTRDGDALTYFTGYLNDRLQYGSCIDSQVAFVSYAGYLYCPKRSAWFSMEVITRKQVTQIGAKDFFRNVSCR